jgi:hypothetical protein
MAQIIVLTPEAKKCLQVVLFNAIQNDPDNDTLHAIYADVTGKKFS